MEGLPARVTLVYWVAVDWALADLQAFRGSLK